MINLLFKKVVARRGKILGCAVVLLGIQMLKQIVVSAK